MNVVFDVNVQKYTGSGTGLFFRKLLGFFGFFDKDNYISSDPSNTRSYVVNGYLGEWRSKGRNGKRLSQDNPASHEFGHMVGLKDRYQGMDPNFKQWSGNVMGAPANQGKVEQRNIDEILGNALNGYQGEKDWEGSIHEMAPSW